MAVRFTTARYNEIAARLGFQFKNRALLRHALTHSSTKRKYDDYERLEFLGDRVLGLIIAEQLFKLHPADREGHMSGRHSALVRGGTCAEVARALALEEFIVVGQSEKGKGLNLNTSVLGDVVEALIGAIYLDGGIENAREFVLRNWQGYLSSAAIQEKDAKTFLQEWALGRAMAIPIYRLKSRDGPEHAPIFAVTVEISGHEPMEGSGKNKRLAEQEAATKFLKREKIRT